MKIGIIGSGFDLLPLFKFLHKYDHEYLIYWDWNNFPYGEKKFETSLSYIQSGLKFLQGKGADCVLVPPVYELYINNILSKKSGNILPLFQNYLIDFCLKGSLIGKIGFVGDYADLEAIENIFPKILENYSFTENQSNTKKFNTKFPTWKKETTLWKYYLLKLGFRDRMVRKTIKFDLNYFKDAGVDTIIPLNLGYIAYDTIIKSKLNAKKTKFYGTAVLQNVFEKLDLSLSKYGITIFVNGRIDMILEQKKWINLLQRKDQITLNIENVD